MINTINQQVQINNNFTISMNKLTETIQKDREIIFDFLTKQTNDQKEKLAIFEVKLNIQEVDKILTEIQDNIILSNLNIIHPSILHQSINPNS